MNLTNDLCVANLMTRNTTNVRDTEDLATAIGMMSTQSLSALPVVNQQGETCGVLSTSDLTSLTYGLQCDVAVLPVVTDCVRKTLTDAMAEDNQDRSVSDLMTRSPVTASIAMTIPEAARLMIENSVHHLPVVEENQSIVGILSTMDIVRAIAFGETASM